MSKQRFPWQLNPELTEERLTIISKQLLKVLDDTYQTLTSSIDDNYTRGTCTFGRQKNSIIQMCLSKRYEWLKLTNPGMDITFEIGGVPVRFFSDNYESPKKPGFFRHNNVDQLFAPDLETPNSWRFVIEKPEFEGEGARVHFVGYNQLEEALSIWTYGEEATTVMHSVDAETPVSVAIELEEILPASVNKTKEAKLSNE